MWSNVNGLKQTKPVDLILFSESFLHTMLHSYKQLTWFKKGDILWHVGDLVISTKFSLVGNKDTVDSRYLEIVGDFRK